jgi:hypothetical protein
MENKTAEVDGEQGAPGKRPPLLLLGFKAAILPQRRHTL